MKFSLILSLSAVILVAGEANAATFAEAIQKSIAYNPKVKSKEENYKAAGYQLQSIWTNLLPAFNFTMGDIHSVTETSPATTQIYSPDSKAKKYGFGVPIFDGGVTFELQKLGKDIKKINEQALKATENAVALQAAQSYIALVQASKELAYLNAVRANFGKLLGLAMQNKQDFSIIGKLSADLVIVDSQILRANETHNQARNAYVAIVGEAPTDSLSTPSEIAVDLDSVTPSSVDTAVQYILEKSPSILMAELAVKAAKDQRSVQFALDFMPKLFFSMDWTRLNTTIPAYGIGASSRNATSGLYLQQTFKFGSIPNYKAKTSALNSAKYDLKSAQDLLTVAVQNAYSMDDTLTKQLKIFDGVTTQLQSTFDKTIEQITKGENVNYLASEGIISFMFQNYMGIVATKVEMGKNRSQLLANLGVLTEIK